MLINRSVVNSYESLFPEALLLLENGELEKAVGKLYLLASNGHVESMKKLGQLLVQDKDLLASYGGYDEGIHWLSEAAYCYDNEAIDAVKLLTGKRARVYNHFMDVDIYPLISMVIAFFIVLNYLKEEVNLFGVFFFFNSAVGFIGSYLRQRYLFGETSWICRHIKIKGYRNGCLLLRNQGYSIQLAISLSLFVIGAVMVAIEKTHGDQLQMVNIMLPVLMSALVILTNTLILIKIAWRNMSIERLQMLMLIAKRLGRRWESVVTFLMLTGNLVVFLLSGVLIL